MSDLFMDNNGVLREVDTRSAGVMKPKFPVGASVRIKRVKENMYYDDDGETIRYGVNSTDAMIRYQGLISRVSDVIRRERDDKSYWVYTLGDSHIFYYAESMLEPIERKEVML